MAVLPDIEDLATVLVCEDDDPTRQIRAANGAAERFDLELPVIVRSGRSKADRLPGFEAAPTTTSRKPTA